MKQVMNNVLLLSVLSGLAWSAGAAAQSPPAGQSGQPMQQSQATGSSRAAAISATEHAAAAEAMFKRMDTDGDAALTTAELDTGHRMMMGAGGQRDMGPGAMGGSMGPGMMDLDGDGAVSAKEHADMANAMFNRMDSDGDGRVTAAEMASAHAMMKGPAGMRGAGMAPGMMGAGMMDAGMHGAGMFHGLPSGDLIELMDLDNDGRISAAEHSAGTRAMFEEADTNKDGSLSMDERAAHHDLMMRRGKDATQKPSGG